MKKPFRSLLVAAVAFIVMVPFLFLLVIPKDTVSAREFARPLIDTMRAEQMPHCRGGPILC